MGMLPSPAVMGWNSSTGLLFSSIMTKMCTVGRLGILLRGAVRRRATETARVLRTVLAAFAVLWGSTLHAEEATIVVHRGEDAVEIYFSLPAEMLVSAFGLPPELLEDADGTVDFESLRLGTWDIGDAAFQNVSARINGAPATFEAMSLMVHPNASMLPLSNPIEGMIAIAVCSVPTPAVPPTLNDLRAYVGYIAYTDTPQGPITLDLPETGRGAFSMSVLDYTNFELRETAQIEVADGGQIRLEADTAPQQTVWVGLVAAAIAGIAALFALTRTHARGLRSSLLGKA